MPEHHDALGLPPSAIKARHLGVATHWVALLLCFAAGGCTDYGRNLDPQAVINCSGGSNYQDGGGAEYLACVQEETARLHPPAPSPAVPSKAAG
jgi:hypothetical protein